LLERAGGNPLYAEEFARMVTERGTVDIPMPESVHGIVASRLDALSPDHKRRLQDAAVVGKVFWRGAVAALDGAASDQLERGLRELERRELIRRERKSSVDGEIEYAFRHVVTRDVAYAQMPRAVRGERHLRAAEWIASLGRPHDNAELVAQHYLAALEYARASGGEIASFAQPAQEALREAGERASSLGAYHAAARYLKAALELATGDVAERGTLLYRYGAALFYGANSGGRELEEAVRVLRRIDPETAARAALLLSDLRHARGDKAAALRWLGQVDDLIAELPDSIVRTEALLARSAVEMFAARFEQAIRLAQEALGHIQGLRRADLRARAFDLIGTSRVDLGEEGGIHDQRRAIEIAREGRATWQVHTAMNNYGVSLVQLGLLHALEQNLEERRRMFEEIGSTAGTTAWFLAADAHAHYVAGRWNAALERIETLLGELTEGETHYLETDVRPIRALIEFARARSEYAQGEAGRAVEIAEHSRDPQSVAGALCVRASMLLAQSGRAAALADFQELLALGEGLVPGLTTSANLPRFVWLAVDLGRGREAQAALEDSPFHRWTAVGGAILAGDAAAAADLLGEIGHRPEEAYARLRAGGNDVNRALAFYRSVGARRYIREAEALLAASA
jgi:hypothetical protein